MGRVDPAGDRPHARRQRVVARRVERHALEPVALAQLGERAGREQPQVRAPQVGVRLPVERVQRVADDRLVAHVHGHRLKPEGEAEDVVPARQVVGRDAGDPVRREHPPGLA